MKRSILRVIAAAAVAIGLTACSDFLTVLTAPLDNKYDLAQKKVSTIVGTGAIGYSGDGGAATQATLNNPQGFALDASGDLFIADTNNQVVRRVDASGTITTFAGTGSVGFSGDGGGAASAQLSYPWAVAVGSDGSVYIADQGSCVVRKVSTAGIISTFAGTGQQCGYSGDGGPANAAKLQGPDGLAFDSSGNLYIADSGSGAIRRVDPSGTITTFAGNGTTGSSGDGGPATSAELANPQGITFDSAGNLYIAENRGNRVRKVDTSGTISTVAGTGVGGYTGDKGPATSAELNTPGGVAVDSSGDLFIADNPNLVVRMVDTSGVITSVFGNPQGTLVSFLVNPVDVIVDSSETFYILDSYRGQVFRVQ